MLAASLAGLGYEIALMRMFSVSLSHHFAFMVVSIAMLGIGAGGALLSLRPAARERSRLTAYALLFAWMVPLSYGLANGLPLDPGRISWDRLQLLYTGLLYLILAAPFLFLGLVIATAYTALAGRANLIYAADLLGAGSGSLLVLWLLSSGGPELAVVSLAALPAALLLAAGRGAVRAAAGLLLALLAMLFLFQPRFFQARISPYKPLSLALAFPGAEHLSTMQSPAARVDLFTGPAARYAPGLSFRYLAPLPEQVGLAVDAGEIHALTDAGDRDQLDFTRYLPASLAYRLGPRQKVLVIDPRGGLAALTAAMHGSAEITTIESLPPVAEAVGAYVRERPSFRFDGQGRTGLARTMLSLSADRYDVIDLSLMAAFPSGIFGFGEDLRYTTEAFTEYLGHLAQDGLLSVSLYIIPPPRTELRLAATLLEAASRAGIPDPGRRLAVIRSWDTLTLVMKRSPLTAGEIRAVRAFCSEMRFDLVHVPGITAGESNIHIRMAGNEYFEAFQRLIEPSTRSAFLRSSLFDLRPATDDRPFFHYYLKLGNLPETYRVMGRKWQYFLEEGYLLPVILLQALLAGAGLVLLPLLRPAGLPGGVRVLPRLSYFAMLGLAFLLVEISMIQKAVLALEHPLHAAATVISATLISSGLGSLLGRRFPALMQARSVLLLAGVVMAMAFAAPLLISAIARFGMALKVALVFLLMMPMGMCMGLPFPLAMSRLGRTAPGLIPWAWAVNGCFSVLSPVLAVMLALAAGYRTVLLAGAGLYLLAYGVMRKGWGEEG